MANDPSPESSHHLQTNMAVHSTNSNCLAQFWSDLIEILERVRGFSNDDLKREEPSASNSVSSTLLALSKRLVALSRPAEAETIHRVCELVVDSPSFGGLGLDEKTALEEADYEETTFLVEAWLEALNSAERSKILSSTIDSRSSETRPMTLAQKIFAQHTVGGCPVAGLQPGDVIRVNVDWILASELSWSGMARTHEQMGSPGIWRNDRFWLAGDHVVHPDVAHVPKIKAMVDAAEKAKKGFKMTEYQGMNYTIMHTEFVRERAEPGMLAIGSDSHTCSAGAVSCLAIGLGTADVMMTLSLGETWFKVPESIRIDFIGTPAAGISGKDVILYILKELKRNTVAGERIVEFGGEGLRHLSCDARFAISNMCTEFGAISGIFEPDGVTSEYISHRRRKTNRSNSIYFKADSDAEYAGRYQINLTKVEPSVAVYPEPDNVVPVSEKAGMELDGVFIGACTTTEEELVLAALVLKAGLGKGLPLANKGKRHYVPGSLPVVESLKKLKLLEIYEAAGFTRGPPGCSYCVGLSAEKALQGETWLSSQNRNFQNRMGKGAFGHITSAVVCAASAFSMTVTDPALLLKELDLEFFERYRGRVEAPLGHINYVEPGLKPASAPSRPQPRRTTSQQDRSTIKEIRSKVIRLPDFVDTDALAPGPALVSCVTDQEFGLHVLEHTHPEFREKVRNGQQVVVAGNAFGVGSSREVAVSALKGAGVQAVIARSFAFIYGRNQPSLGLLGFTISDDEFHNLAEEETDIFIDVSRRKVKVGGKEFDFVLSEIEYNLTVNKGIADSYKKYGKNIWSEMTSGGAMTMEEAAMEGETISPMPKKDTDW